MCRPTVTEDVDDTGAVLARVSCADGTSAPRRWAAMSSVDAPDRDDSGRALLGADLAWSSRKLDGQARVQPVPSPARARGRRPYELSAMLRIPASGGVPYRDQRPWHGGMLYDRRVGETVRRSEAIRPSLPVETHVPELPHQVGRVHEDLVGQVCLQEINRHQEWSKDCGFEVERLWTRASSRRRHRRNRSGDRDPESVRRRRGMKARIRDEGTQSGR